jgi:hypothetical protein
MFKKTRSADLVTVPKLVGRFDKVRVTFLGATFLKPNDPQKPVYAEDDFVSKLLDEVFHKQSILSKVKGLVSKSHYCRGCEANLMGLKAHRRRFALMIAYKDLPEFKLELEMPAIPCRSCGTNNAINDGGTEGAVCGAIAKAFGSLKQILDKTMTQTR